MSALDSLACTQADIEERAKDLEYRCGIFLQAREHLVALDQAMQPGNAEFEMDQDEEEAEL